VQANSNANPHFLQCLRGLAFKRCSGRYSYPDFSTEETNHPKITNPSLEAANWAHRINVHRRLEVSDISLSFEGTIQCKQCDIPLDCVGQWLGEIPKAFVNFLDYSLCRAKQILIADYNISVQCSNKQKSRGGIGIEIGYLFNAHPIFKGGDTTCRAVIVPGTTIGSGGGEIPRGNSSTVRVCIWSKFNIKLHRMKLKSKNHNNSNSSFLGGKYPKDQAHKCLWVQRTVK